MTDSQFFIIVLRDSKKTHPIKQGEFIRSEDYDAHIYQGKVFGLSELNDLYPKVLDEYKDYQYSPPVPVLVKKICTPLIKARAAKAVKALEKLKNSNNDRNRTKGSPVEDHLIR